jgi:hypothetical protein
LSVVVEIFSGSPIAGFGLVGADGIDGDGLRLECRAAILLWR